MSATIETMTGCTDAQNAHVTDDLTAPLLVTGDVIIDGRVNAGADIRAGGNVCIGGSVQSARIVCAGELQVPAGAIVGGSVAVYRGLVCRSAGHRVLTPTELAVGFDEQYQDSPSNAPPKLKPHFVAPPTCERSWIACSARM